MRASSMEATVTIALHFGGNSLGVIEGLVEISRTHPIAERLAQVSCDNAMLVHKTTTALNRSGRQHQETESKLAGVAVA